MTSPVTKQETEIALPMGESTLAVASMFETEEMKTEALVANMKGLEGAISKIAAHIKQLKEQCEAKQRIITTLHSEEYLLDADRTSLARKVHSYASGAKLENLNSISTDQKALKELESSSAALKDRAESLYRETSINGISARK